MESTRDVLQEISEELREMKSAIENSTVGDQIGDKLEEIKFSIDNIEGKLDEIDKLGEIADALSWLKWLIIVFAITFFISGIKSCIGF